MTEQRSRRHCCRQVHSPALLRLSRSRSHCSILTDGSCRSKRLIRNSSMTGRSVKDSPACAARSRRSDIHSNPHRSRFGVVEAKQRQRHQRSESESLTASATPVMLKGPALRLLMINRLGVQTMVPFFNTVDAKDAWKRKTKLDRKREGLERSCGGNHKHMSFIFLLLSGVCRAGQGLRSGSMGSLGAEQGSDPNNLTESRRRCA